MHCFRTGVEKGMKLCTAVQEGCGYKDTLARLATLIRWQNISLCALLINRSSYNANLSLTLEDSNQIYLMKPLPEHVICTLDYVQ